MNACLQCRRVKMKCESSGQGVACQRCTRKSMECIFEPHRRGRKPGTRISKERGVAPTQTHRYSYGSRSERTVVAPGYNVPGALPAKKGSNPDSSGLQPSSVLNHEAMRGRFSLRSILGPGDTERPELRDVEPDSSSSSEDPISLGLVNLSIARCLFDHFITVLNPYISQLDPILHTFPYVRRKSSFLLSAILATSSKIFNSTFHTKIHEHTQSLLAMNFLTGEKSPEIAQGTLILTYWKEPRDTRVWVLLGYVIRMCTDMNWHNLGHVQHQDANLGEIERREIRNKERTWLVLFVYDRSMSLQTGRPSMIERDELIMSIEQWCDDSLATVNDHLLGAFVTLRLLTSEAARLLNAQFLDGNLSRTQGIESQFDFIHARMREWEKRWTQPFEGIPQTEGNCHEFLIRFYSSHTMLQVFSLPLQGMLNSGASEVSLDLSVFWISYSSALSMLKLISTFPSQACFAQDSIHVMIAYCGAFLVKLAHSVPESIATQIKPEIIKAMHEATAAFYSQGPPSGSTCTLQAQFLNKIATKLSDSDCSEIPENEAQSTELSSLPEYVGDFLSDQGCEGRQWKNGTLDFPRHREVALSGGRTEDPNDFFTDVYWTQVFADAGFNVEDGIFLPQ